jgi:ribosomal protein L18
VALLPGEVARLLSVLDDRERLIMRLRYGLGGEEPRTLKAVAELLAELEHPGFNDAVSRLERGQRRRPYPHTVKALAEGAREGGLNF